MNRRLSLLLAGPVIAGTTLAGCTSNSPSDAGNGELTVTSTATECQVSANSAPSGTVVFKVKNTGNEVTEFYLLASDGLRIVGEIENITPQLTRDLVVQVPPGKYYTSCKPGMVGNGIQAAFTVTDSGKKLEATGDDKALITTATGLYASYVKDQTDKLLSGTEAFVKAYKAGDFAKARALYAPTRIYWERIETVAESFGDLDPSMDAREADLEPGQKWTGWHKIEKDLWPPKTGYTALTAAERNSVADQLLKDTRTLHSRTRTQTYTVDGMGNGSKGLLDEVATGKVTGEEETWSHTDLWDFQGNVDGAKVAFENLRPLLTKKDPALETSVATKFTALQKVLDKHRKGDGFKLYTELSKTEIKELSDAVNALSEPLSKVTAAVLK
ncbi:iron uptake system protein EfeO [Calidifontibacter indicus]|uniref:iron uptake system protein EfeO n=1 Tax=Calidifontibacter indicus TaxID=419650 RepID=UPI003D71B631